MKSLNSDYYLDLLAVFLYFVSALSEYISFAAHVNAFLSPVVFNRNYSVFIETPPQLELFRGLIFSVLIEKSQEVSFAVLVYLAERSP
jgi:hypothetical protein